MSGAFLSFAHIGQVAVAAGAAVAISCADRSKETARATRSVRRPQHRPVVKSRRNTETDREKIATAAARQRHRAYLTEALQKSYKKKEHW